MSDLNVHEAMERALGWVALGAKVFPCQPEDRRFLPDGWPEDKRPGYKAPLTKRGFYDASDDFEAVATTWLVDYPGALVGIWTGGSDFIVLDIDKKNDKDGFASIKNRGLPIGDTWSVKTASGGEHRFFQSESVDVKPGADILGLTGVDLRAGGSYVIAWADAPESRDVFSKDIPEWMLTDSARDDFSGEGFSGSVVDWLESIPQEPLPSSRTRDFIASIPKHNFDHPKMVELAWNAVRLGSENETGVVQAIDALKAEWLRGEYDTPAYRRDFDLALRGAITKGGKLQQPLPSMRSYIAAMQAAERASAKPDIDKIERTISDKMTPAEMARARKALFLACADRGLDARTALTLVARSKSYSLAQHVSVESVWFGEGEPIFAAVEHEEEPDLDGLTEPEEEPVSGPESDTPIEITTLSEFERMKSADGGTFLTEEDEKFLDEINPDSKSPYFGKPNRMWWGEEYIEWVKDSLDHFNGPYHRLLRWMVLSIIAGTWGHVPIKGKAMSPALYGMALGPSTSGKSESWSMALSVIDAYYGIEDSPLIGDISKVSAIAIHHSLIRRDALPSMVYGDEVQGFFEDINTSHWQGTILKDLSEYYEGTVPPKNMLNDKEFSGKRAKTTLTTYLTGIASLMLDTITLKLWRNGFFYRYVWTFSDPITDSEDDDEVSMSASAASYTKKPEEWAEQFQKVHNLSELRYGLNRRVEWTPEALARFKQFKKRLRELLWKSSLWDDIYKRMNLRFSQSIMKCATLIALIEGKEKIGMREVLIAIDQAWEWHRAAVFAVTETQVDPFFRLARELYDFCQKNAIRQIGADPRIHQAVIMRERRFGKAQEIEFLLRQLIAEGWMHKEGDFYTMPEETR